MADPNFDAIPAELKGPRQWVLWKTITRAGKLTKVPFDSQGHEGDSADPSRWESYPQVVDAYNNDNNRGKFDGIGFTFDVLDTYAGVDLDNCINEDGSIKSAAKAVLDKLHSYCEISPSGKGIKIFLKAKNPVRIRKGDGKYQQGFESKKPDLEIEIYYGYRFFTLTGNRLTDYPATIEDSNEGLTEILKEIFKSRNYFEGDGEQKPQHEAVEGSGEPQSQPLSPDAAERLQDLFAADPIFKDDLYTPAPVGTRSDTEFRLCARLWEAGFDEDEIYHIITSSPQTKWLDRNDSYRWDTLKNAVAQSEANRGSRKGGAPGQGEREDGKGEAPGISAEEIKTELKADRRKILDPVFLHKLLRLSPLEREALIGEAKDEGLLPKGVRTSTIYREIEQLSATLQRQKHDEDEGAKADIDPGVREKALAIATRGDSLKYLVWQGQRNHLGDISYQKVLIGSIASSASLTSNGIQPGGTGDKGSGKSDACVAVYHLVPEGRRLDGSLSPMSLFYLQEKGLLQPGMVLFSDDVEYEGITPIYKKSTARFQHGITHYTVSSGKNREALELKIPPRMVWWLTSVESVANEQAFDRQYPISTDSSLGHKTRVAKEISARRARRELRLVVDEGIQVARAIFADIFENGPFQVVIPRADLAEWIKVADFRGQEQFWDLVDALAILRWRQRRRDDNGWLIADDQDLIEAKDIMMGHKVAHISDLTEAEVKVVGVLTDGLPRTQKEITEALGIAQSTLSERLTSIMAKSAIITEDNERGRKLYSINPNMNINAGYWQNLELIHLKIDCEEAYRRQKIALSSCYRYVIGIPIGIIINNSNRIPSSLSVNIEGVLDLSQCGVCLGLKKEREIHSPGEKTDNPQNQQHEPSSDTDKSTDPPSIDTDNANSKACGIPIRSSGGSVHKKGLDPNRLVWVRFLKDYRTQILRQGTTNSWIDKLYLAGEKAQFPAQRALELVKVGVAELVEA